MHLTEIDASVVQLRLSHTQLKKIYVALFRDLHAGGPEALDALDDDDMLLTIQTYLQRLARAAGVDGTIHSEWEAFLGMTDQPSCAARFAARRDEVA